MCWSGGALTILLLGALGCEGSVETVPGSRPGLVRESDLADRSENDVPENHERRLAEAHYVDDTLCADCHREIYDSYQQVAMSKSFYDFSPTNTIESFQENHLFHEPSGNHYEMTVADGQLQITRYRLREDGERIQVHSQAASYVVGSGNHVRTYLYRNPAGELFQMPVVWYSQQQAWGMAPGYDAPDHEDFSRPITRQCMFCHNAYPNVNAGADAWGMPHIFPEKLPQGIGCQRCHGPGSYHVQTCDATEDLSVGRQAVRDSIVNPARLSARLQDDVCHQCHLQPMSQRTSFLRRFGRHDYAYRPGQPLNHHSLYFEPDRDNRFADHFEINHHPYRLSQSACYRQTPGGIRCTDCHDPHVKIPAAQRAGHYRAQCLSCHDSQDCLDEVNGRNADADCVACHMPARRTTDVVHVTMTDHRIGRYFDRDRLTAPREEIDVPMDLPIRPWAPDGHGSLPDNIELYELLSRLLDGDPTSVPAMERSMSEDSPLPLEPAMQLGHQYLSTRQYAKARQTLEREGLEDRSLPVLDVNRGIALLGLKQNEDALSCFLRIVSEHPNNVAAWYHLGVAQSRVGQTDQAIDALKTALRLRPSYGKARNKLGRMYAMQNRLDDAARQFEAAIRFDANDLDSCRELSTVYRRQRRWQEAVRCVRDALLFSEHDDSLRRELALLLIDPKNADHRNPQLALKTANRLFESRSSMDHVLIRTMAMLENRQYRPAIDLIGKSIQNERKAEAGLLLATGQRAVGSTDAARANFQAARTALGKPSDRLARIVLEYAETEFLSTDVAK